MRHASRLFPVAVVTLATALALPATAVAKSPAPSGLFGSSSPTPSQSASPSASASPTDSPSPSATPTPATINGPDVASYQHPATANYPNGKPINWTAVARDGMSFAIVKATESTTYVNPFFADDYNGALNAGLVHGAYHFARPAYPLASTANAQASYFANEIGAVNTTQTLPPVLDLEVTGGLPRADLVTWAQIFLYKLRSLTGRTPMLYTYPSFWTDVLADPGAFSRFPLWMASYGSSAPTAELWQYTDAASIRGISGQVDESEFLGDDGLPWSTLSDGTVPVPWPTAAPKPPRAVTAVAGPTTATVSWVPGNDGSSRTTSYTVTSNPGGITATVNGAVNSATVTGLDPSTAYTFTVTARSSAGTSSASAATAPVTPIVGTLLASTQAASISYGQPLHVSAVLTRADNHAPVVKQQVTLYRSPVGKTEWTEHATAVTGSDGSVAFTLHPTRSLQVMLSFNGAPGYQTSSAQTLTVVHSVVTGALSRATIRHGRYVRLSGTLSPLISGEEVTLQQLVGKVWQAVRTKAVDDKGNYSFRLRAQRKKSTQTYRVIVAAGHGLGGARTHALLLSVT
jgi:GH25 family lysozyme M1 (1,4-beta-N-acetylmuramidase)